MRRRRRAPEPERALRSPAVDSYDEISYPGAAFPQTHPDRLATLARLFGGRPGSVERCRVLELGCGDGGNLIPMAYALPEAHFVGLDLNAAAVARGLATIEALGLGNVQLDVGDIGTLEARALGRFDHVIAHGVYSWVPEEVRAALLPLCRACLERDGTAFVSFNALPGGHLRQVIRDALRRQVGGIADPRARIDAARALLRRLAEREQYDGALGRELQRTLTAADSLIYHDVLAETNAFQSITEFAAHAAAAGLRYLCNAELHDGIDGVAGEQIDAPGDRVAREQQLDMLTLRMFRQAILVRDDAHATGRLRADALAGMHIRSSLRPPRNVRLTGRAIDQFRAPGGGTLRIDHPLAKAALLELADAWPGSVAFEPLAGAAAARLSEPRDEATLSAALLETYRRRAIELHAWQPPVAAEPDERPTASALARRQAAGGEYVVTLRHETVRLEDSRSRRLLTLLDGTRDRRALAGALGLDQRATRELPQRLEQLAELGLLEPPGLSRSGRRTAAC
jgi:SAM-dependent methyltransferase